DGRPGGMFIAGWAELISVWTAAKTGRLILIAMDKKSTVATLRLPETLTKCGASVTTRLALALAIPRAREACFSSKVRHRLTSVRYPRVTVQLNQSLSRTPRRTQQSITQLMDRHRLRLQPCIPALFQFRPVKPSMLLRRRPGLVPAWLRRERTPLLLRSIFREAVQPWL